MPASDPLTMRCPTAWMKRASSAICVCSAVTSVLGALVVEVVGVPLAEVAGFPALADSPCPSTTPAARANRIATTVTTW